MMEMLSEELLLQIKSHNDKGLYFEQYDASPVIDRMYHDIRSMQQQVNTLQEELNIAHYANETLSNQFHKNREHNHMQGQQIQTLREQVNTLTKQIEAALTDLEAYKPLTAIVVLKSALQSIKESPREEQSE
jgi:predicted  nucleic acid-binding Zn-ribbon protein